MPLYTFRCKSCNHEFEHSCKISERDEALRGSCPSCVHPEKCTLEQIITKVNIGDPTGRAKVPLEFKEKVLDKVDAVPGAAKRESKFNVERSASGY